MSDAMPELKSEVDGVSRTGRKICQQKQVDDPELLGKRLDQLKQDYHLCAQQVLFTEFLLFILICPFYS